jgi:hypothetical protein
MHENIQATVGLIACCNQQGLYQKSKSNKNISVQELGIRQK